MITELLNNFAFMLEQNTWLTPLIAFIGGILTSFSPCCISSVPLVISYVGSGSTDNRRAFKLSLSFAVGMALTLTILGVAVAVLGRLLLFTGSWWYILLGILMVLMTLQIWNVYNFIPSTYLQGKSTKRGYVGAFVAGVAGGLFSTPCSTPILVALLAVVAQQGRLLYGAMLLLIYAIGHSTLVLIAGTFTGVVKSITQNNKYSTLTMYINYLMGFIVLLFAFYLFYQGF